MNKKWQYYEINQEEVEKLEEEYKIDKLLATVLVNRGVTSENATLFLNPTRRDFHDPKTMPDMNIAVDRIIQAIEQNEKTVIYGDYDVDGITSITVLKSFLSERGLQVDQYIPNRITEGYGLNKEAIKKIADQNYKLMITVDCGITSIEEIEYAKEKGIETIITDHHEPLDVLPSALAVVDCKRKDNQYPFRELAGVGVVFKLIQAIGQKLKLEEKEYLKYLDIVSVGTISDIVPLVDENRVITKLGLKLVACTKNKGLKAILDSIKYSKIDSSSISFGVAPRINACGRMGYAYDALDLLLSKSEDDARVKAVNLIRYNNERQEKEKIIFEEAIKQIQEENLEHENSIILGGENWHHGVIGIVASKITDLYFKPCILVCFEDEAEIGKGSGRSIPGFDLHKALIQCSDNLAGFGGHSMAIGLSVKKDNFKKFKKQFQQIVEKSNICDILPIIKIDAVLKIDNLTKEMVKCLELLEPFGEANKMPNFAFRNLKVDSIRALTEGKHLRLTLKSNNNTYINAIGFNLGYLVDDYKIGDKVDIVGNLEINTYNNVESIQINLKDLMKSV